MKYVYILQYCWDYEGSQLEGVFDSAEKARKHYKRCACSDDLCLVRVQLNVPYRETTMEDVCL